MTVNQNFSPIPQIYAPNTAILIGKNFWKISQFRRKTYIVCKVWTKWFWLEFEVLPPNYVTVNQNFSPIPQIYAPNTAILIGKNFWKISQFRRKTYIVCKVWTKWFWLEFEVLHPQLCDSESKFQSYSTNLHSKHYYSDNKEFLENFPVSQENLQSVPNRYKNRSPIQYSVPYSVPHSMFQSFRLFVDFWKFHTYSTDLQTQGHKSS